MKRARKSSSCAVSLSLLSLLTSVADGHHSRSEYDVNSTTEIEGEVLSVKWQNPHIELRLRGQAGSGSAGEWHLEANSAVAMNQAEVSAGLIRPGMQIRVAGWASTRRDHRMQFTNVLLPNGIEVIFAPEASARWSDRFIGRGATTAPRATARLPDDGRRIYRVWSWEPPAPGAVADLWMMRAPDEFPLTEQARTDASDWNEDDPNDNRELQCIAPGMPATMGNPHPIEFVEMDGAIELRSEEFDVVRTIHMVPASDPTTVAPSPLGYSVGRWEGEELVVETTRLNAPFFTRRGVRQSTSARVIERFRIDAPRGRLTDVLTFMDPVYLTEAFVTELHWVWDERASVQRFDCHVTG